ncbi:putative efflux protein MATE family, partial [Candidatus Termititenax spirochaetophilus]
SANSSSAVLSKNLRGCRGLGVYFGLQSFIFMPVFGLNNAMVPIIAFNFGARHKRRILSTIKLSFLYALGVMCLGVLIFHLVPTRLLMFFNASANMQAVGVPALRTISWHFPAAAVCIVAISVFQALGHGVESLVLSFARQILVLLPVAWLLSLTGQVALIWWAFPIAEVAALSLAVLFSRRVYVQQIESLPE